MNSAWAPPVVCAQIRRSGAVACALPVGGAGLAAGRAGGSSRAEGRARPGPARALPGGLVRGRAPGITLSVAVPAWVACWFQSGWMVWYGRAHAQAARLWLAARPGCRWRRAQAVGAGRCRRAARARSRVTATAAAAAAAATASGWRMPACAHGSPDAASRYRSARVIATSAGTVKHPSSHVIQLSARCPAKWLPLAFPVLPGGTRGPARTRPAPGPAAARCRRLRAATSRARRGSCHARGIARQGRVPAPRAPGTPPRAGAATSGASAGRSRDTYDRNVFAAPGGGRPRHNSSTSRPDRTTRPASTASNASTARCRGPPSPTSRPALTACTGPKNRNSNTDERHRAIGPGSESVDHPE
jgi:hypothetical protein